MIAELLRRWWRPAALAVAAAAIVLAATAATLPDAGYRAAGMRLMDDVDRVRGPHGSLKAGLSGSSFPLPILVAAAGAKEDPQASVRGATWMGALAIALAVAIVAALTWSVGGLPAGLVAAVLLLTTPGTLFHARTLGPEAAVMLAYALLLWAAVRITAGLTSAILASLAFTLCLTASHEAALMAIPWVLAAYFASHRWRDVPRPAGVAAEGALPVAALLPLIAGPILLFMLWPYLAANGGKGWLEVIVTPFKARHPPILVGGEVYDQEIGRAPHTAAGVGLFFLRLPLLTAGLVVLGAVQVVRGVRNGDGRRRATFALGALITLVLLAGVNGSPYYNGTDGVLPALPFAALLGGLGGGRLWQALRERWPAALRLPPVIGATAALALICAPAAIELASAYPLEPAYRSTFVGGTDGAARRGFETRTDYLLPAEAVEWMNASLPPRSAVAFLQEGERMRALLGNLRKRGIVRPDIEPAGAYHATHLVLMRMPAAPLYQDALRWLKSPVFTLEHAGVPQLTIYAF